jgi:glucose-6-phosphate 1-dehydrogenase
VEEVRSRAESRVLYDRHGRPCEIEEPRPFGLVVFGASGDLAKRKIIPAVYRLYRDGLLPESLFVLGAARTRLTDGEFRAQMEGSVREGFGEEFDEPSWEKFAAKLHYETVDYTDVASYQKLASKLTPLGERHGTEGNVILYLAVPPKVYETIIGNLGTSGLSREGSGYTHVVIEKPFGHDLESARKLNAVLGRSFSERQIYRMDHYLAKETVQNILMFRFANFIFEPLWNRNHIDHVQITVSETLGVEHRAGYYERAGVLRDMFQNHIFQLLALTAMEPPSVFEADRVRDEKGKVFRSLRPFSLDALEEEIVLGQYGEGSMGGKAVPAYRDEEGIASASLTPTYAAMKLFVDNWRWKGVPFYLRSGKRLSNRKAEISVHFRGVPHLMFAGYMEEEIEPNTLVLRIQPDEGINLVFQTKMPGSKVCLNPVMMDFAYEKVLALEAYERVLLDCMNGDQMLFVRQDGVELTWSFISPALEKLEAEAQKLKFPNYAAGSHGPVDADRLLERDGRRWRAL